MARVAKGGVDFELICVSHYCHKADKYFSRLFTCDSRPCLRHSQETRLFPFCLQMEKVCCDSFSRGMSVFLPHLKTMARLFMPFFNIAKLALNPTSVFSFLTLYYDGLGMSVSSL